MSFRNMAITTVNALKLGCILLLAFSFLEILDLLEKVKMLESVKVVLHPEDATYTYRNDDHPNALPIRIDETALEVEWLDDKVYGLYADEDWKSLFPGDAGFVSLGPPPSESEPKSCSEWNQNVFAVGMYHQLHCLDVFRHSYVAAKAGALTFPGNGTGFDHHVNHCLSYMREMVLCAADTTLIHVVDLESTNQRGRYGASSIGTVHRCRDWTQVRKFVEEHKASP